MLLTLDSPTVLRIDNINKVQETELAKQLSYTKKEVSLEISKMKKQRYWLVSKWGAEWFQTKMDELKKNLTGTLLFEDQRGYWTYSGNKDRLMFLFKGDVTFVSNVVYPDFKLIPWDKKPTKIPRYYQNECHDALVAVPHGHVELATGCHAAGQGILMYDGSIKKVEDVVLGDKLMGPDSKPRNVLKLYTGTQTMAKITPIKGESFVVNLDHILSLKQTNKRSNYRLEVFSKRRKDYKGLDRIVNISVREYLEKSKTFKHVHKLYTASIDFHEENNLSIPPYVLGIWLGDGTSSKPDLTSMDKELSQVWTEWGLENNCKTKIYDIPNNRASTYSLTGQVNSKNNCMSLLKEMNLIKNKHIPSPYLTSSRNERLELLAGLIDTDGYYHNGTMEISQKSNKMASDILFLCRSLGFRALNKVEYKKCQTGNGGYYNRISISGDVDQIPTKLFRKQAPKRKQIKNTALTGFSIDIISPDKYYGFELDGDSLYLMDNFLVTHNSGKTGVLIQVAKTLGLPSIIMTPSASIGRQIYEECKELFGKKRVGLFGDGKRELGKHILISIAKSVAMVEDPEEIKEFKKYQAVIVDESHTISAELLSKSCLTTLAHCPYRYFFSATQERNDGRDIFLSGIIGPRVYEKSISSLQEEGYLAKLSTMMLSVKSDSKYSGDNIILANQHHIYKNDTIINFVASTIKVCVESGTPILVLIDELGQEEALRNKLGAGFYGFCEGKSKDNAKVVDDFNNGKILCVVGTKAISVGTDFRANEVTINWTGMRSTTKTKQGVIGRSTRTTATKKEAKLIDFCINNVDTLKRHAIARVKLYEEVGAVTWVDL